MMDMWPLQFSPNTRCAGLGIGWDVVPAHLCFQPCCDAYDRRYQWQRSYQNVE